LFLEGDSGFVEKKCLIQSIRILLLLKRNYIVLYVKEYWLVIKRRSLFGKAMDHEKKMTHQNKVVPGKIKLKKTKE
jgi:hypothetical protein